MVLSYKDLIQYILYVWVMLNCINSAAGNTDITHVNKSWKNRSSFILLKMEM